MNTPTLRYRYHAEILEPEHVFLMAETGHRVLKGSIFIHMLPLLDGQHTVPDIITALRPDFSMMQVMHALSYLKRQDYITEPVADMPPEIAAYWEAMGVSADVASEKLGQMRVTVRVLGDLPPLDDFKAALHEHGVQIGDADQSDFEIVVVDDYLQPALKQINAQALQTGRPWMLVKPVGAVLWLGPIFRPDATACWQCLANRLNGKRDIESFLQLHKQRDLPFPVSSARLPAALQMALSMALIEVTRFIVKPEDHPLLNKIITHDTLKSEQQSHHIVRRPQCAVCGEPQYRENRHPEPPALVSQQKRFIIDGGHRTLTPREMLERLEYHISPITGVISVITPAVEVKDAIYIYSGIHNFGFKGDMDWDNLRKNLAQGSSGKGLTRDQCRASLIGESLERYSGVLQGYEYAMQASYHELAEKNIAIHPNDAMLYSDKQYATRAEINALDMRFHHIPEPFNPDEVVDWSPVWSLGDEHFKYIPTAFCYYDYWRDERRSDPVFCMGDSNGCASGSTLEEAVLQGLMELMERDSVALWWYNRVQRPAIDIESFGDRRLIAARDHYRSLGRDVWLLDLSSDLDIPSFAALSRRVDGCESEEILMGFGTHLDPKIAASRALTEMAEVLTAVHPDDDKRYERMAIADSNMLDWMKTATIDQHPYLMPHAELPVRTFTDFPQHASQDLLDDINHCVQVLKAQGIDVYILDQTRPDIELNVVKVIAPGLRHFWSRLAPGRLYDVPVRLGWLDEPVAEDDMNPIPMFL